MKVTSYNVNAINPYKQQQRSMSAVGNKPTFQDRIEISSAAKELQVSSNYQNERAEKVQNIKADIESGQYKVNARQVAENMLNYYRI